MQGILSKFGTTGAVLMVVMFLAILFAVMMPGSSDTGRNVGSAAVMAVQDATISAVVSPVIGEYALGVFQVPRPTDGQVVGIITVGILALTAHQLWSRRSVYANPLDAGTGFTSDGSPTGGSAGSKGMGLHQGDLAGGDRPQGTRLMAIPG